MKGFTDVGSFNEVCIHQDKGGRVAIGVMARRNSNDGYGQVPDLAEEMDKIHQEPRR